MQFQKMTKRVRRTAAGAVGQEKLKVINCTTAFLTHFIPTLPGVRPASFFVPYFYCRSVNNWFSVDSRVERSPCSFSVFFPPVATNFCAGWLLLPLLMATSMAQGVVGSTFGGCVFLLFLYFALFWVPCSWGQLELWQMILTYGLKL